MSDAINEYVDQEGLYNTEGRRGVENLCQIVGAIGYDDPQNYGQLSRNATLGSLMLFLEDNPGAIQAIYEWIDEQDVSDWDDSVKQHMETEG